MPLGRQFWPAVFPRVVLAKTDSGLIAEAKLQKKATLSVLLEKRLDFKAGEHAV